MYGCNFKIGGFMKVYNTLNNRVEEFKPINDKEVLMYVCGPTVYNYIHIGNARPLIVFDVLARHLISLGYNVKYVQNFTDIDDKIIKKANEENVNCSVITERYIKAFMEDISNLNLLENIVRPKVTENLDNIIKMIEKLIEYGYAYKKGGDVVFSVRKFKNYGKLSNQKIDELNAGHRIEIDKFKEDPLDFVLWKEKKENEPGYESPFSVGRPGWHIECSAMIKNLLGDNIDIHAGGQDLIFPHHENEIAQSICSTNEKTSFVKYWMHNAYVTLNSEKMSKSLGNFWLLRDVLDKYDGNVIRHFILTSHYRKGLDFSFEGLDASKKFLQNISNIIKKISNKKSSNENKQLIDICNEYKKEFTDALNDDLNTPKALATFAVFMKNISKSAEIEADFSYVIETIKETFEDILGIKIIDLNNNSQEINEKLLEILLDVRKVLRNNKNYELSDMIRNELLKLGININDKKE